MYSGLLKVLWQAHKYEAVVEICKRGLQKAQATNRLLFHIDMAKALMLLGKADEAVVEADVAVQLADDGTRLYCRRTRSLVLADAGRIQQALAECQSLLKEFTQPADVRDIRYTLSSIYTTAKMHAKAEEQLQLILDADPNDATANNDLGYIWADQGKKLPEAEKHVRKAIELDRTQRNSGSDVRTDNDQDAAAYVDSLGWVLFRRGRHEEARKELEKAVSLPDGDDDPVVWDHLGDVCYRLNDHHRSRAAWTKAVELYEVARRRRPDDRLKEIKNKLKLLDSQTQHR